MAEDFGGSRKGLVGRPFEQRPGASQCAIVPEIWSAAEARQSAFIDGYSDSGVNACVGVTESPLLHTVDIACAALTVWFDTCASRRADSSLIIRTFDVASAYRQVGLSEKGRQFAFLRVYDPESKETSFFRSLVLPFGAFRSVLS